MPRIGLAAWGVAGPVDAAFAHAIRAGLDHVQVDFGTVLRGAGQRARQLLALVSSSGIEITAVGARLMNHLRFGADADMCRALIDAVLDFAVRLDVKQVFFPTFHANRMDYELMRAAETLAWACQQAAPLDISVGVESAQGASEIGRLFDVAGGCPLRLVADTYNPQTEGNSFSELLTTHTSAFFPFIHLKDGRAGQMGAARLGQGDGEVAERLRMALSLLAPESIVIESKFSDTDAATELLQDVAFVRHQLAT